MSSGSLMQLVAQGAQDVYLTGNPQITFFRTVYRRHTNFTMDSLEQTFTGAADFGRKVQCQVARVGDLCAKSYLQVTLPPLNVGPLVTSTNNGVTTTAPTTGTATWIEFVGNALIQTVELDIGGQKIDQHYAEYLQIWYELAENAGSRDAYRKIVGNFAANDCISSQNIYVPLKFFFNSNYGNALPLIAICFHTVNISFTFNPVSMLYTGSPGLSAPFSMQYCSLWIDYIYLTPDERKRFAQTPHEYVFEQIQFTGDETLTSASNKVKLSFNHPVKELMWFGRVDDYLTTLNQFFNFTDAAVDPNAAPKGGMNCVASAKLQFNGQDRTALRDSIYWNYVQPYQHHSSTPRTGVNAYSFAISPEDHQPSGTCNFSRIDNAVLFLNLTPASYANGRTVRVQIYAKNYNVLRIVGGMAGLAYAS